MLLPSAYCIALSFKILILLELGLDMTFKLPTPKKFVLTDPNSFKSVLSMNSDSTFTLITSGYAVVMGKLTTGPNYIILLN